MIIRVSLVSLCGFFGDNIKEIIIIKLHVTQLYAINLIMIESHD